MSNQTINGRILLRCDVSANWTSLNPVLLKGEMGVEIDTSKFKFGDGVTAWSSLIYAGGGASVSLADLGITVTAGDINSIADKIGIYAGAEAPTNTKQLWVDTDEEASSGSSGSFTSLEQLALSSLAGRTDVPSGMFYRAGYLLNAMELSADVTEIKDNAFYAAANIPSISGENVTTIGYESFYNCTALTSLDMPMVTSIGTGAFRGCTALTSATLPSLITLPLNTFNSCTSLTSISLPMVTSIGEGAFYNCTALTSLSLPSSMTTISHNSFSGCPNLTSITIAKASGSIAGAPWGATNATVTWTG